MEIRADYPPWRGPRRLRRRREEILIDNVRPARQLSRELMPMLVERGQLNGVHPRRVEMLEHIELRNRDDRAKGGVTEEVGRNKTCHLHDALHCHVNGIERDERDRGVLRRHPLCMRNRSVSEITDRLDRLVRQAGFELLQDLGAHGIQALAFGGETKRVHRRHLAVTAR